MLKEGIALRSMWRRLYRNFLDSIFEECASHHIALTPDFAVDFMEELLERIASTGQEAVGPDKGAPRKPRIFRFDAPAFRREAHHYAVDRYYKTYFPRKRGAPPLPLDYLDRILTLRRKGWNDERIARQLGQPRDNIRKQISAAEKRWRDALDGIEKIKHDFPHMIAQDASRQSKHQKTNGKAGK